MNPPKCPAEDYILWLIASPKVASRTWFSSIQLIWWLMIRHQVNLMVLTLSWSQAIGQQNIKL